MIEDSTSLRSKDDSAEFIWYEQSDTWYSYFLVSEFSALASLEKFVPPEQTPHPVRKAEVMKLLFKDKNYTSDTVDILGDYITAAQLTGVKAWSWPCIRLDYANIVGYRDKSSRQGVWGNA